MEAADVAVRAADATAAAAAGAANIAAAAGIAAGAANIAAATAAAGAANIAAATAAAAAVAANATDCIVAAAGIAAGMGHKIREQNPGHLRTQIVTGVAGHMISSKKKMSRRLPSTTFYASSFPVATANCQNPQSFPGDSRNPAP